MSVQEDEGRRWIQVEVEVPGTPEEVWEAIATGPGISSWFAPSELEEKVGGKFVCHMGDMDGVGTLTEWEPPHRYAMEGEHVAIDGPKLATEWIVEPRSGGTCIVRVVHSLFTDSADWDSEIENMESGWPACFVVLRTYLEYFRGQPCRILRLFAGSEAPESEAWNTLASGLGIADAAPEERWKTPASAPALTGAVASIEDSQALIRLDDPVPGILMSGAYTMAGQVMVSIGFYLYGAEAEAYAAREEPAWQKWLQEQFSALAT